MSWGEGYQSKKTDRQIRSAKLDASLAEILNEELRRLHVYLEKGTTQESKDWARERITKLHNAYFNGQIQVER